MRKPIRIAVVGVGNCASSLLQGVAYYRQHEQRGQPDTTGLMHYKVGPYGPGDVEVVAAFDIDERKVGLHFGKAIFSLPNNTQVFHPEVPAGPVVQMGEILDGVSEHMA